MDPKVQYLLPAMAGLGFLAGFAVRQPQETQAPAASAPERPGPRSARPRGEGAGVPAGAPVVGVAGMKSADTLADLLALDDTEDLYARLALWLLDAPEEDIAAFWSAYAGRERSQRDTELLDLLFAQWTRIDPVAAIEAAKGSGHEGIPWWAWAIHDPDAAIAAARDAPAEMAGFVMRAIGQFHPERALRMLEENPGFAQWNAIEGIINGLARTDPEAALAFQRLHGRMHDTKAIEKLTRDDPHAALEWLRRQPRGDNDSMGAFLGTLQRENPSMIAELAEGLPPGSLRRQLESAAFRHLAETDPAEALRQARDTASPRLAAERLAVLGSRMATDDFQGALGIFGDLFAACPDAGNRMLWTRRPNGSGGSLAAIEGVTPFIDQLIAADPQATMEAALRMPGVDAAPGRQIIHHSGVDGSAAAAVASRWGSQDPEGLAGWLETQEPGPDFDRGAVYASRGYLGRKQFDEGIEWSMRISDESRRSSAVQSAFQLWQNNDRQSARQWVQEADLPADVRKSLEPYLGEP